AVRRQLNQGAGATVGDIEVALGIEGQTVGEVQAGSEGADPAAVGCHLAHRAGFVVGNVEVTCGVEGQAGRAGKPGGEPDRGGVGGGAVGDEDVPLGVADHPGG